MSMPNHRKFVRKTTIAQLVRLLFVGGTVLGVAAPASAATCNWLVAAGNWATTGNWSCGAVPGALDTANVGVGQAATVTGAQGATVVGNAGTVNISNNSSLTILGANTNTGNINLQSVGNLTDLFISGVVSLNGSGTVTLSNNTQNRIFGAAASLTIGAGQTIQGAGQLGAGGTLAVVNDGTVIANQSNVFTVSTASGVTNNSVLRGDGATLSIFNTAVTQGALGVLNAINGGTVVLNNSSVTGGSFTTATGGVIATQTGVFTNSLSGVNNQGTFNIVNNSGVSLNGTLTNNAIINMQSVGNVTDLIANGAQSINGTGTINLSNNPQNRIYGTGVTSSLTLGSGQTVQGAGQIGVVAGFSLINQGTVIATQSNPLLINAAAGVTNTGTLRADGGTLQLQTTINSGGGSIEARNGSLVQLMNGAVINNASFSSTLGGLIATQAGGAVTLGGGTVSGPVTITNNSFLTLAGDVTYNGTLSLASVGNVTDLILSGARTLSGAVTVQLSNNGQNRIYGAALNDSFTAASSVTIQGSGVIGVTAGFSFINQGTVIATQSNPLLINASVVTNTGTLRADGGTLQLQTTINSGGGSIEARNGSLVQLMNGAVINNANFSASGVGSLIATQTGGAVTLGGGMVSGPVTITNNSSLTLTGDVTYNGTLSLASVGNVTDLILSGARTLSGAAIVQLSNNSQNRIYGITGADSFTIANGVTIQGAGQLGAAQLGAIINNGTVIANQSNALTVNTAGGVTNNNAMRGDGATLSIQNTAVTQGALGVLNAINNGTVLLNNSSVTGGSLTTASGGVIATQSGVFTNSLSGVTNQGTLNIVNNSGLNLGGTLTNNGAVNLLSVGNVTDLVSTGNRTINGIGTINLSNNTQNRIYAAAAGNSLTLGSGQTLQGAGQIGAGTQFNFTNNGSVIGNVSNVLAFSSTGTVTNNNIVRADAGTVTITNTIFGQGAGGVLSAINGGVVNLTGNATVSGGTLTTASGGQITTVGGNSATITNLINSGTFNVANNSTLLLGGTITNNGALNVNSGGNLTDVQVVGSATLGGSGITTLSNNTQNRIFAAVAGNTLTIGAGQLLQGAGQFGANSNLNIVNQGTITANQSNALNVQVSGGATIQNQPGGLMQATTGTLNLSNVIANSGTIAANGGVVNAIAGFTGTGTASTSSTGQLNVGAASSVGTLTNNGNGASALALGVNNITVSSDYTNANSGTGNSFNRRANVTGAGQILAGGNAAQAITGANVTNGNTTNATLTINNVRVGATTFNYQVANTGVTGPSLRGAIQTNVNGANLNDVRLSGAGVTASNYNTGIPGSNTGNLGVTFTAASAGALAALTGQVLNLRSNFDNIADQKLNIVLGAGAAAYNAAVGSATPAPAVVANQRVGGINNTAITISNTAVPGTFSEDLNASVSGFSGNAGFTGAGGVNGLLAGASNNAGLGVRVDTSTAGAKSGTVTLDYQTAGAVNGVSNGLGTASVGSQTINVSGNVFNAAVGSATPTPVVIANQRVGGSNSQVLSVSNTAAAGAFSEALNASFSGVTAGITNNGGSVTNLIAGGSNSAAMSVGVNTATAGLRSGSVTLAYQTDGTGANGNSGLSAISAGTQTINVSGNVYLAAQGQIQTAALNFGTVQVGQSVSQTLSISNIAVGAAGFVEDLHASFGASSGTGAGLISGAGSITGLTAGSTNNVGMVVNVNTAAAGAVNGAIAVNYQTAGAVNGVSNGLGVAAAGSENFGVQGTINAVGNVINQASPLINTPNINLGNVRVGASSPLANVSVTNVATIPPQAALNASISGNGLISGSGAFNLLAPGATDSASLQVGMNTATAGARNGTATIAFVSDANNVGNCAPNCQLNLASQNVTVTGGVYRLANPTVNSGPITLAARVGDASPTAAISISNTSADAFTEGLNVARGATPVGFNSSGSITNLVAGGTSAGAIQVALNTATAGSFGGNQALNFVSTGAGTTGAADVSVGSGAVSLAGNVYTPAVAQQNTAAVNFGIVHVGDVVATQGVSVTNAAAVTALNDVLRASFSGASAPFSGSGNLGAGLAAGQTDAASLRVGMNTGAAGVFNGSATFSAASHNAQLADAALGALNVSLSGTVNNYAQSVFRFGSGAGTFTQNGSIFTLDFGTVFQGSGILSSTLMAGNGAVGPSDLMDGLFQFLDALEFGESGFGGFSDLGAQQFFGPLGFNFDTTNLGAFSDTILLQAIGHNASGYSGALADSTLIVMGSVIARNANVPEPDSRTLLALGLLALLYAGSRRRVSRRPRP